MNKQDIISEIAEGADVSKAAAGRMLDTMVRSIKSAVVKGEKVSISNFGSFEKRLRKERVGRHIVTGARLSIPAQEVPTFTPAKGFKSKANS